VNKLREDILSFFLVSCFLRKIQPKKSKLKNELNEKPIPAYIGASWGVVIIGLWNYNTSEINKKGCYLSILLMGIYAVLLLEKVVRDKAEKMKVSPMY
jgi:uncharacterized membrane protein YiaA